MITLTQHFPIAQVPIEGRDYQTVFIPPKERASIEFQGGLMRLSYASPQRGCTSQSLADDTRWLRYYAAEFSRVASSLPVERQRLDENGRIIGADLSSGQLSDIYNATMARLKHYQLTRGRRGAISSFSKASRRRLLRFVSRFRSDVRGLFVTVTYRQNMRDHKLAKSHLDKLLRWIKRRHDGAVLWRMEYQKRGAIHFHLILFGARYLSSKDITAYWQSMTGDDSYPKVQRLDGRRHVLTYVSKYIAKHDAPSDASTRFSGCAAEARRGFVYLIMSHIRILGGNQYVFLLAALLARSAPAFVGRHWGVLRRELLPFADGVRVSFEGDARILAEFKRAVRRSTRWVRRSSVSTVRLLDGSQHTITDHWIERGRWSVSKRVQGYTLFTDAARWLAFWRWSLEDTWLVRTFDEERIKSAKVLAR